MVFVSLIIFCFKVQFFLFFYRNGSGETAKEQKRQQTLRKFVNLILERKSGPHTTAPIPVSRTLFVRNVQFDTLEDDIRNIFSPFGEIKSVFDLIAKRGLVFVTYVSSSFLFSEKTALTIV